MTLVQGLIRDLKKNRKLSWVIVGPLQAHGPSRIALTPLLTTWVETAAGAESDIVKDLTPSRRKLAAHAEHVAQLFAADGIPFCCVWHRSGDPAVYGCFSAEWEKKDAVAAVWDYVIEEVVALGRAMLNDH